MIENTVKLSGRFIHFTSPKGVLPLEFLIESGKDKEKFFVQVEGKNAFIFLRKARKGSRIFVSGKISQVKKRLILKAYTLSFMQPKTEKRD